MWIYALIYRNAIDEDHFLCGDTDDITKCTKVKVLEYDMIVQNNIFLKRKDDMSK